MNYNLIIWHIAIKAIVYSTKFIIPNLLSIRLQKTKLLKISEKD